MPSKTSIEHFDVHAAVTRKIITAIEEGAGAFKLPWIESSGRTLTRPINVASSAPYNGVNVLVLWIEALAQGFTSGVWGTYRQWQARGAQVRKGESSSLIVFYKMTGERDEDHEEDPGRRRMFARASRVFNACQIEGFEPTAELPASETTFEPLARAEVLLRGVGANIREAADMACYLPTQDKSSCRAVSVSSGVRPVRLPKASTRPSATNWCIGAVQAGASIATSAADLVRMPTLWRNLSPNLARRSFAQI